MERTVSGRAGRVSRTGRAALAVVLGAAVLAGCAGQPGAAAIVDGRVISQDELAQAREDLASLFPEADAAGVLSYLIVGPFFLDEASERGVGVSRDDARALLKQELEASGADTTAEFGDDALDVIRFTMAVQSLGALPEGEEALGEAEEALMGADIEVNPRYGTFDPQTGIQRPSYPWLTPAG